MCTCYATMMPSRLLNMENEQPLSHERVEGGDSQLAITVSCFASNSFRSPTRQPPPDLNLWQKFCDAAAPHDGNTVSVIARHDVRRKCGTKPSTVDPNRRGGGRASDGQTRP